MNLRRRLEDLERLPPRTPRGPSAQARGRMREHLDRVAALRRGELGPEGAADVEATSAALERRLASGRGEGYR
jgi:hypothetical protein